jgi:phospholipase D1/2
LRRPAANAQKWRLDRLLQRKAQEGVKIYVIIYQNVGTTVPIDSTYTKYSLLGLHPNVFVQRSPRHVGGLGGQNVFFWAHHEKIISIDHTVGFVGGLDLCLGRWDTPEHILVDDKPSGFEDGLEGKLIKDPQVWPGKDYSNPRIHDFYELDKPYEDMHDRQQVPRMPWHDVSMQFTGQPARDIARHFVQRWNYLLRTKPPSKPCPILLPPPDFKPVELEGLNLTGTCEVQILRSCGQWSMGLQDKTEQSIQTAYLKCIEQSEHFVYIENQFFITSCNSDGTKIENQIGDAIVNRILRAQKEGTEWRAIIIMPLMPGFQNTIDSPDGSSLRLIMYAQYYSLCRGETSIYGRLRRANIDPEDYISVYSLRGWGKIGDQEQLVTEQIYIHAKIMIVDDRVAIIGSANINERSMRGNRDSEVAAIIRDTEQYEITMAGQPFMVGKFAHTLRMRLQLEHLGVNTDDFEQRAHMMDGLARQKPPNVKSSDLEKGRRPALPTQLFSFNHDEPWRGKYASFTSETSSDEEGGIHDENEKHKAWYQDKFGKMDMDTPSKEKSLKKTFTASPEETTPSHSRSASPDRVKVRTNDNSINRRPPNLQANHRDFHDLQEEGNADERFSPDDAKSPSNDDSEKDHKRTHRPAIHKSVDRATIGRPTVTTSANPLTGGIPPNMMGKPTPLDRAEELEQAKRDPEIKRKSVGESSGETLSEPNAVSPALLSPAVLGSPKPHVHHGDGGSFNLEPPKVSQVTEKEIPRVDPYNFIDPLAETFFFDQWHAVAEHNTAVYRRVFRPMPDNDVKTWAEYKEFFAYGERVAKAQGGEKGKMRTQAEQSGASGPVGAPTGGKLFSVSKADHGKRDGVKEYAKGGEDVAKEENERIKEDLKQTKGRLKHDEDEFKDEMKHIDKEMKEDLSEAKLSLEHTASEPGSAPLSPTSTRRRRAKSNAITGGMAILPRDTMEELLGEVQGHLVIWPTDWLEKEDANGNFLYNIDKYVLCYMFLTSRVQPMEIYD